MKSFRLSLVKFTLGIFLFGLALWAYPIEGYASGSNYFWLERGTITTPSSYSFSNTVNVNDNAPLIQYGLVPYSSFDVDFSVRFASDVTNYVAPYNLDCSFRIVVSVLFSSSDGAAYSQPLFSGYYHLNTDNFTYTDDLNFHFSASLDGIPTGLRVQVFDGALRTSSYEYDSVDLSTGSIDSSFSSTLTAQSTLSFLCSFSNFSFEQGSSGGGSSTIINNTTGNLVPIGYSSLNFGLNGSTYFLGASRIFEPSYLSPMMFSYDFANSVQGVVSSAPLTLAMGGYDSPPNTAHASPIAVIGDTRAGEYELTIALCLSNSPSSAQLSALTTLSNWGFEFNRGYTGQQFSMPDNARISYTNFTDSKTGFVYTSVYFYFTTPDYFDSFLIRKAPTLNNIRVGAFAFNKYTGTISDQLTQSSKQWDYQNPSHNSFSSANSSAASTVSAFSNIESEAFSNLDTAMSGAGVNDFNISVISTPMATVSAMINQTYNILPELIKWLLLAVLVIGIFAVIISANNYVNKD